MAHPMMNRNHGKTRSASVAPWIGSFQGTWKTCGWKTSRSQVMFTNSIAAMSNPRNASRESNRPGLPPPGTTGDPSGPVPPTLRSVSPIA
jgi:hypothetical protein